MPAKRATAAVIGVATSMTMGIIGVNYGLLPDDQVLGGGALFGNQLQSQQGWGERAAGEPGADRPGALPDPPPVVDPPPSDSPATPGSEDGGPVPITTASGDRGGQVLGHTPKSQPVTQPGPVRSSTTGLTGAQSKGGQATGPRSIGSAPSNLPTGSSAATGRNPSSSGERPRQGTSEPIRSQPIPGGGSAAGGSSTPGGNSSGPGATGGGQDDRSRSGKGQQRDHGRPGKSQQSDNSNPGGSGGSVSQPIRQPAHQGSRQGIGGKQATGKQGIGASQASR